MKIRHFNFLLLCFILCSFNFYAQQNNTDDDSSTNSLKIAAKAGINFSRNFGDVSDNESFLTDFNVGAVIKIPTNLSFEIQAEPQISRVGGKIEGEVVKRFTFLDIPVLAQIHTIENWSFEAGPKIAITLDQKQNRNGSLESVDRLKTITLGLVAGTTYNFDSDWFGQFRINYWISDVIRKDAGDTEGTSILLFQFSVGYWLD